MKKNDRKNPFQCTNEEALAAYEKSISRGDKPMHTPTPWKVDENDELPIAIIADTEDGLGICEMEGQKTKAGVKQAEANAAFIVTACNAHEDLVRACQSALNYLNDDYPSTEIDLSYVLRTALTKAGMKESA